MALSNGPSRPAGRRAPYGATGLPSAGPGRRAGGVALAGATPAGFALFFQNYSTFLAQPGIYLGGSVGQARVAWARVRARAPDASGEARGRARLRGRFEWSVLDWNEPAIGFYKKLGAVPMGDWTIFRVTGDALQRLGSDE